MKRSVILPWLFAALCIAFNASRGRAEDASGRALFLLGASGHVMSTETVDAAIVIGGSLLVEGVVHGPAVAVGGNVDVRPGAVVDGGVYAVGGALNIDENARVKGARTQVASGDFGVVVSQLSAGQGERSTPGTWLGPVMRLAQVMAVLVLGLLLAVVAPRQLQAVRATLPNGLG